MPPDDSTEMGKKLQAAGVSAKVVIVEGVGHGWWEGEKQEQAIQKAVGFLDEEWKR